MDDLLAEIRDVLVEAPFWGAVARIAIVLVIAVVVQFIGNRSITRIVRRFADRSPKLSRDSLRGAESQEMAQALMTERQNQRAHSLGSLARSALAITVWAVAIMTILSIAGINVAPLLASAGVLGVVLGFGAQTLVADYLAGIAMIFEDQLGIGDTIDLGVVLGEVEEVALRYTRVRDSWGVVWYVRNGTIQYVANQSQGWTYALVEIPVPYDEDLERVQQVIDAAGKAMLEDPDYNVMLLDAPYYSALQEVTATSAIIRVNTKVVPDGNQWYAARVIRQQMKQALDDAGIRIPLDGIEIRTVQAQAAAGPGPGRAAGAERHASLKDPDAGKRHP